jgi:nucleotide-binding universal stress UspA family protein
MSFKTILVHLHDPERSQRLLSAAIPVARQAGAHVIGLSVLPPFYVIPAFDATGAGVLAGEHRDAYAKDMARLKSSFEEVTRGQTFAAEWREADAGTGNATDVILTHGRSVDLVVASQRNPDWPGSEQLEDPVRLAIELGRPLLLVPNRGPIHLPPRRVTVAWNGRREAARAVFDALPFLVGASDVNVLWINPEHEVEKSGDLPGDDICTTLARHGVRCEASRSSAAATDVGSEILRQASAYGSDLIVMGCYGHSRIREFVLGGASRDVMTGTEIPVLLSH